MVIFISTIAVLCGYTGDPNIDDIKYEQCVLEYVRCAVGKAGEYDMVKLKVCAEEQGANFEEAKTKAGSLD